MKFNIINYILKNWSYDVKNENMIDNPSYKLKHSKYWKKELMSFFSLKKNKLNV